MIAPAQQIEPTQRAPELPKIGPAEVEWSEDMTDFDFVPGTCRHADRFRIMITNTNSDERNPNYWQMFREFITDLMDRGIDAGEGWVGIPARPLPPPREKGRFTVMRPAGVRLAIDFGNVRHAHDIILDVVNEEDPHTAREMAVEFLEDVSKLEVR